VERKRKYKYVYWMVKDKSKAERIVKHNPNERLLEQFMDYKGYIYNELVSPLKFNETGLIGKTCPVCGEGEIVVSNVTGSGLLYELVCNVCGTVFDMNDYGRYNTTYDVEETGEESGGKQWLEIFSNETIGES